MAEELTSAKPEPTAEIVPAVEPAPVPASSAFPLTCDDITVIARYPHEMEVANKSLVEWCERKVAATRAEGADLLSNLEVAERNRYGCAKTLRRAYDKSVKMEHYYDKIKEALMLGYCIVPNFPVTMFAIRTDKNKPRQDPKDRPSAAAKLEPVMLPSGEGDYKNPDGIVYSRGSDDHKIFFAHSFRSEIDFPFVMAKPEIFNATARAMADKVFDEIGSLPGVKPKGDPIIVGRIRDPRSTTYNKKFISFLIAWYVDTREL